MKQLYVIATPIGNLSDITIRAIKIILTSDVIACEDTRRTGKLINHFRNLSAANKLVIEGVKINEKQKLISYYDQIEETRSMEIVNYIEAGLSVALLSDSG